MNRKFRDGDSKRKRADITCRTTRSSQMRPVIDNVGHKLAGLPGDPPLSPVTAAGPTVLVPDTDQRWSFEFKNWSETEVEQELAALQTSVDGSYSAPAVADREPDLLSPPPGTLDMYPSR